MEFLSDDPTYLAGGLAILGAIFLIAMRLTQQGKYLIRAGIALGLAALVLVTEQLWVTDNERIEQVVYDLRRAVAASNSQGVFAHLTPDVEYVQGQAGQALSGDATRDFIQTNLERTRFDFVRVTRLETNAGSQTGRGSAVFRILTGGSHEFGGITYNFGSTNLDFSLGFQETAPKVWKIDRITLTRPPREMPNPGGASRATSAPKIQFNFQRRPRYRPPLPESERSR
jgi:hypothetical protein